jgi:nucleoside-diphosphate-sugar epimerase
MRVLITGGGGFLGSHLAERHLEQGYDVVCIDNFATGLRSNKELLQGLPGAGERLKFVEADVCESWDKWSAGLGDFFETVYHFASPASPPHYQRLGLETMWTNTVGLAKAMQFADAHRGRVVFASTSEIYGDPLVSPQPESYWGNVNTLGPRSCYDEAKRFGESLIYTHNLKYGTKHGLVRIFNTYGPRMNPNDGRVIINFLVQAKEGRPLSIYGSGKQTRSFCFVDDLISGIMRYAKTSLTEPINLGNDKEFTILEAAETVQKIFSEKSPTLEFQELPVDDPKQRRPDLTRAKTLLAPWKPEVSLEAGLRRMLSALN